MSAGLTFGSTAEACPLEPMIERGPAPPPFGGPIGGADWGGGPPCMPPPIGGPPIGGPPWFIIGGAANCYGRLGGGTPWFLPGPLGFLIIGGAYPPITGGPCGGPWGGPYDWAYCNGGAWSGGCLLTIGGGLTDWPPPPWFGAGRLTFPDIELGSVF